MPEVNVPQGTLRYRDEGSGPAIVFVHGALVDGRLWDPVVDRLKGDFRCIVPDLPFGSHAVPVDDDADLSPHGVAALINAFLGQLGLDDVTLVGNDSGGAMSQLVATRHPRRLARLVLTNCDAFENFPPKAFRGLIVAARIPGLLRAMLAPMRLRAARRLPIAYGWLTKRPLPEDLLREWAVRPLDDKAIMRDARKFAGGIRPEILLDNTPKLVGFDKPVLIAWGREDKFFPLAHAHRLATIFPDARVVEIDDARTFVSWDQPEVLADAIAAFVRQPVAVG